MGTAQTARQMRYDEDHTVRVALKLNKGTDADIIQRLREKPSMQGYIKALIRADIQKES